MVSTVKRYAIVAVALVGMVVSMAALYGRLGLESGASTVVLLGGGFISATAFGWYQHDKSTRQFDERSLQIHYRSGYIAFWTVYWLLFLLTIGGIQESGVSQLPVDPYGVVAALWLFGTLTVVVTRLWYKRQF
ncbi:hypothetical protein [Natrinema sp. 74]|uniref:hypothetical protein n=1 Tax=Natrinema sp. 74 TaxID=3384159 RepID=UPI0038D4B4CE